MERGQRGAIAPRAAFVVPWLHVGLGADLAVAVAAGAGSGRRCFALLGRRVHCKLGSSAGLQGSSTGLHDLAG